jgi:Protein of unknown function (DUF1570)
VLEKGVDMANCSHARSWLNRARNILFVVTFWCGLANIALAQATPPTSSSAPLQKKLLDPRAFGLEIAPGELIPGNGNRVVTNDAQGEAVVAKVHVQIGKNYVVLLPDGQLVVRKNSEATITERPFVAISKEKLAERLTSKEFKNFKVKQTKHYLYIYNSSEEFSIGTSRILESMLPGVEKYAEQQKIATHDPEVPLVVIMFRTEDEFQQYRRMPEGVVAYYHTLTNQVLMFEQSRQFQTRPDMAIQQAISTIAHEGTHQILHNIGVQQRLSVWPMWLSEGIAEFFAPTSFGKRLTWKGAAQVNDMRMFELEQYLKSKGAADPNGDTVKHTVLAGQLTSTGYASAWSLTHYLATKKRAEFNKYMAEVAKFGPFEGAVDREPPGIVSDNLTTFEKYFGSDYIDLEKKLVLHLQKLPYNDPFKEFPHFVAMLSYAEGKRTRREVGTFHSPSLATKWLQEMREKKEAGGVGETIIRQFPNRAAAELFAKSWLQGG